MTVRRAVLSDADDVARMEREYIDCPWTADQIRGEIESSNAVFLVAEADGGIVGYLSGAVAFDECEISNIAVDGSYRRQGIGSALFAAFMPAVAERGVKRVYLLVRDGNTAATELYKSIGFSSVGKRHGYYGDGDAVIMSRNV